MSPRKRSEQRLVRPWSFGEPSRGRRPVTLAVEEPMAIELDGHRVATTMRTPGNDFELAVGFCHNEGLLDGHKVLEVKYCANGSAAATAFNIVTVSTGGKAPEPTPRLATTTSSCGFCGTDEIDELAAKLDPLVGDAIEWGVLADAPIKLRPMQDLFDATGAVHAAGVVDAEGGVALAREDVGRHNAVDKLAGRMLLDGQLPATGKAVVVSGRASFELVHKAWAAGFRALVAVSAPTALAVATAQRAGLQLGGFARDGALEIYVDA
ncbi:MAG: formate dehydrogenase accessory sulfurtransferase FdhD [Acidimicrobiales bacterium]|nr:formate dehydrogenase accessory sulfurtransferase FdhD [Acidimicrobiales bacterium]MDG1877313.1 formate dehydrogenase accessory sulfurtransferase FdhD [Acidimicrobiales bacterium]